MPFMLQTCGHALRFMTSDGVCRRCSMDANGVLAGQDMENIAPESPSSPDTMLVDKSSPTPTAAAMPSAKADTSSPDPDVFSRHVEKLVGVLINSDGVEIGDAVQHVARAMSTFTAAEQADFITHLIIMYCEARREDQPKIILLIKELSKKNVLARTHFFQSAKKITADIAQLTVDWPNLYDCSTFLIYTCLEMIDKTTETLRGLETILAKAGEPHAGRFLDGFHRFCHLPADGSAPLPRKSLTASDAHQLKSLPFVRPAEAVRDRLMRPLSQVDATPKGGRLTYSREALLRIEQRTKGHKVDGLMEKVMMIKSEGGRKEEREGGGKRPRYVSESAVGSEMGAKRLLESTSPVLPMIIGEGHGRAHFEKFAPTPRHIILPPRTESGDHAQHLSQSPSKHAAREYLGQPFQRFDRPRTGSTNENMRPHVHPPHPGGHQQHQPPFVRQPHFRSSYSVSEPTAAGAGDGYRRQQPAANAKTKKFLTALSVERDSDAGPESPPVTLGPGERTWARGSGSLKPLTSQRKNTDENWRRETPVP